MKLRQLQKTFMSKLHQQKNGGNVSELDFLTQETGKGSRGRQQQTVTIGFNQQQLQVVDNMEDIVNERDEEITRIAKSIEELSQIFKGQVRVSGFNVTRGRPGLARPTRQYTPPLNTRRPPPRHTYH
jgi:hypothetical protein